VDALEAVAAEVRKVAAPHLARTLKPALLARPANKIKAPAPWDLPAPRGPWTHKMRSRPAAPVPATNVPNSTSWERKSQTTYQHRPQHKRSSPKRQLRLVVSDWCSWVDAAGSTPAPLAKTPEALTAKATPARGPVAQATSEAAAAARSSVAAAAAKAAAGSMVCAAARSVGVAAVAVVLVAAAAATAAVAVEGVAVERVAVEGVAVEVAAATAAAAAAAGRSAEWSA